MSPEQQEMIDRGAERIAGMNLAAPTLDGISTVTQDNKQAHSRRTPVKGVCVNCGKHHSRHQTAGGDAYCTTKPGDDRQFTLERQQPAEAAPGAITREQAQRLADLIASKESRRVEWDVCLDAANTREAQFTAACVELDEFIASITAK